eukprot:scaffold116317_cov18-Tisochrysis_lutea.AAC.1
MMRTWALVSCSYDILLAHAIEEARAAALCCPFLTREVQQSNRSHPTTGAHCTSAGDDEIEDYLNEQQQRRQQGAAEVLDDDFFPDDLPAQQCPPPPRFQASSQQAQQGPSAQGGNKHQHAPTQAKRAAGGPAPASAPTDTQTKRPRMETSIPARGAAVTAATKVPDNLDDLFDDTEPLRAGVVTPTRPAAPASAVGVGAEASPVRSTPLAPAYQAPRILASEVRACVRVCVCKCVYVCVCARPLLQPCSACMSQSHNAATQRCVQQTFTQALPPPFTCRWMASAYL